MRSLYFNPIVLLLSILPLTKAVAQSNYSLDKDLHFAKWKNSYPNYGKFTSPLFKMPLDKIYATKFEDKANNDLNLNRYIPISDEVVSKMIYSGRLHIGSKNLIFNNEGNQGRIFGSQKPIPFHLYSKPRNDGRVDVPVN